LICLLVRYHATFGALLVADGQDFSYGYIEIGFIYSRLKNVSLWESLQNLVRLILVVGVCEAELPDEPIAERQEAHDIIGFIVCCSDQRAVHICKLNLGKVNRGSV